MDFELGANYAPDWGGIPPHMSSGDFPIWQRYLALNRQKYNYFFYDVYLIAPVDLPKGLPEELARMWRLNIAKRVDAVGVSEGMTELIEVRVNAGAGALGAIQIYLDLWALARPLSGPFKGIIITDRADPILPALAAARGIEVIEA